MKTPSASRTLNANSLTARACLTQRCDFPRNAFLIRRVMSPDHALRGCNSCSCTTLLGLADAEPRDDLRGAGLPQQHLLGLLGRRGPQRHSGKSSTPATQEVISRVLRHLSVSGGRWTPCKNTFAVASSRDGRDSRPHRDRAFLHTRSEEHTSELQSPYVISYAVFCL